MSRKVVVDGEVRAAGGIVTREGPGGWEVAVVHRPHRSDWSFPKGHLHPGEDDLAAARREVEEETGLVVEVGEELGTTRYVDPDGRRKAVRYWQMRVAPDTATGSPDDEVDEVRWVSASVAADLLSYDDDRELLGRLGGSASTA